MILESEVPARSADDSAESVVNQGDQKVAINILDRLVKAGVNPLTAATRVSDVITEVADGRKEEPKE